MPPQGLLPGLTARDFEWLESKREEWNRIREGPGSPEPPTPWMGKLEVLRAAAAIRAYQLETGAPPARLEELVPGLLPRVPRDPFGAGPLRYEVRGDTWSIESSGKVQAVRPASTGGMEVAPLPLRFEWPPKPESPR